MHHKACSHVIAYGLANKKMDAHSNAVAFVKPMRKKRGGPREEIVIPGSVRIVFRIFYPEFQA